MLSKSTCSSSLRAFTLFLLLLTIAGCSERATILVDAGGSERAVSRATLHHLREFAAEDRSVPVERLLYEHGYRVLDGVAITAPDGTRRTYDWADVAETARWQMNGTLMIGGEALRAARVEGVPSSVMDGVVAALTDIAPTAAAALGLPAPAKATGHALATGPAERVLLLFLDGFGYARYIEARDAGLIPVLAVLGEPAVALGVYPPSTAVATAAVLTGAPPVDNGVRDRGSRTTEAETLFDVAAAAGRSAVAVEGSALAFNLRNAEITLSGDRDGNGSTDDNVRVNALAALNAGMPDLLWVHFHGIDDAGHTYGVDSPEERAAIAGVDAAVGDILAALPPGTRVIIFADHGMHNVVEEGRLGNHGHLIARDMLVPVWVVDF